MHADRHAHRYTDIRMQTVSQTSRQAHRHSGRWSEKSNRQVIRQITHTGVGGQSSQTGS